MKRNEVPINWTLIVTSLIVISFIVICNSMPEFPTGADTNGFGSVGDNGFDGSSLNSIPVDDVSDPIEDDVNLGGDEIADGGDEDIGGGGDGGGEDIGGGGDSGGGGGGDGGDEHDVGNDEGDKEKGDEGEEDEEEGGDEDEPSICMSTSQLIALIKTITELIEESVHSGEPYNPLEDPQVYQFWQ